MNKIMFIMFSVLTIMMVTVTICSEQPQQFPFNLGASIFFSSMVFFTGKELLNE